jgi:replicative DNA helicase
VHSQISFSPLANLCIAASGAQHYRPAMSFAADERSGTPADLAAERRVLGAFLLDPRTLMEFEDHLEPTDFYHEPHQHVYECMLKLSATGDHIDVITVADELSAIKKLDAVGGANFLVNMLADTGTTIGLKSFISIIRKKADIRSMIEAATTIATEGYDPGVDRQEFFDQSEKKIFDVLSGGKNQPIKPIREIMKTTMEMLQKQLNDGGEIAGIPSGFVALDNILLGLQRTDLIVLAARPAMGKTALALTIASHAALREGCSVALFSLEMGSEQLAMRLMAGEAHVNLKELKGGRPAMDDFRKLGDAMTRLSESNIWIDDSPGVSLADVRTRCRRLALNKERGGLDLIVIDYLQLMRPSSARLPREQQISEMSRGLKELGKELNVPVMCLSQLNRGVESRQDKRPMLSDLRESGAIEQDADVILFVYRDEYYNPDSDDKGIAEIIVGKHRNGETGTAKLSFVGKYAKFGNLSPEGHF